MTLPLTARSFVLLYTLLPSVFPISGFSTRHASRAQFEPFPTSDRVFFQHSIRGTLTADLGKKYTVERKKKDIRYAEDADGIARYVTTDGINAEQRQPTRERHDIRISLNFGHAFRSSSAPSNSRGITSFLSLPPGKISLLSS